MITALIYTKLMYKCISEFNVFALFSSFFFSLKKDKCKCRKKKISTEKELPGVIISSRRTKEKKKHSANKQNDAKNDCREKKKKYKL